MSDKCTHILGQGHEPMIGSVSSKWLGEAVAELLGQLGNMTTNLHEINLRLTEIRDELYQQRKP